MAIIKGSKAIQLVRQEYRWDPQNNTGLIEREYHGSTLSALGFYSKNIGGSQSVSVQLDSGVGRVVLQTPTTATVSPEQDYVERYEVSIEFVEKEIWQVPAIAQEARLYDERPNQTADAPFYREACEEMARNKLSYINPADYPLSAQVIRYLRDGVTGYELEYVVVRRSRKVARNGQNIASVGDGLLIYSTAQLQLPDDVAFSVPDSSALTPISSDYIWGWRRRPSTSSVEGMFVDQSSEFILSQWSSLFYTQSSGVASW